jgi:uncharacterized coiled-coil protein SlyX
METGDFATERETSPRRWRLSFSDAMNAVTNALSSSVSREGASPEDRTAANSVLQKTIDELQRKLIEASDDKNEAIKTISDKAADALNNLREHDQKEIDSLSSSLLNAQTEIQRLQAALEASAASKGAQEELASLLAARDRANAQVALLQSELDKKDSELADLSTQMRSAQNDSVSTEAIDELNAKLRKKQNELDSKSDELQNLKDRYEDEIDDLKKQIHDAAERGVSIEAAPIIANDLESISWLDDSRVLDHTCSLATIPSLTPIFDLIYDVAIDISDPDLMHLAECREAVTANAIVESDGKWTAVHKEKPLKGSTIPRWDLGPLQILEATAASLYKQRKRLGTFSHLVKDVGEPSTGDAPSPKMLEVLTHSKTGSPYVVLFLIRFMDMVRAFFDPGALENRHVVIPKSDLGDHQQAANKVSNYVNAWAEANKSDPLTILLRLYLKAASIEGMAKQVGRSSMPAVEQRLVASIASLPDRTSQA